MSVIIVDPMNESTLMELVQNVFLMKSCLLMVDHAKRLPVKVDKYWLKAKVVLIVHFTKELFKMDPNVDIPVERMKNCYGMELVNSVRKAI